jgi:TPR repeat protein
MDLGFRLLAQQSVLENQRSAMYWFGRAAEQNNADAVFQIGLAYYEGRGLPGTYSDRLRVAIEYFSRSANLGSTNAARVLGEIYLRPSIQNYQAAVYWFEKGGYFESVADTFRDQKDYVSGIEITFDTVRAFLAANALCLDQYLQHADQTLFV